MNENPWRTPRLSSDAMSLMALLLGRGGGIRIGPLLRASRMTPDDLVAALKELDERWWIDAVWRSDLAHRPESLPERFRELRRVVTTRTGRHCYRFVPKF